MVSDYSTPEKLIINSKVNPNLDVLFSGQIAPNPNDLLDMKKFDDMIGDLKTKYDYIVLDSAPVMLVSDTLHLIENSDVVMYVVTVSYTHLDVYKRQDLESRLKRYLTDPMAVSYTHLDVYKRQVQDAG